MAIPTPCTHCVTTPETSFITDANGDMACGTVIWHDAQADILPASFDIVIDVNNNGQFDEGYDILDSFTLCLADDSDNDKVLDYTDNCLDEPNRDQEDIDIDSFGGMPVTTAPMTTTQGRKTSIPQVVMDAEMPVSVKVTLSPTGM